MVSEANHGDTASEANHGDTASEANHGDTASEANHGDLASRGYQAGSVAGPGHTSRMLWLRWSWRDLRSRWLSVIAIALVISIGTGVYAGLGSTSTWRRLSNDASYNELAMHDLRVQLSPGAFAPAGSLRELVTGVEHADWIDSAEERLIMATQVDASDASSTVLVPGRLVGIDVAAGRVDRLDVSVGRAPLDGAAEVVLEAKFAAHYGLPPEGALTFAGGQLVDYVGHGVTPEYFLITGIEEGGFLAGASYAVVFASLRTAQEITGVGSRVNDLVLTLTPDADRAVVERELRAAVSGRSDLAASVLTRENDAGFRLLYDDIDADQKLWNVISIIVVLAATLAAFNLVSRIVEAQRREIGIQMALGVPPRRLAVRPLLIGAQIALVGSVAGVLVGLAVGAAMRNLLTELLPLPVWRTPFQFGIFAQAAVLGFLLPFAASLYPVWRAIGVEPIEAIRTGHLAARSTGLAAFGRKLPLPGGSLAQLPLRNLLRSPRRTLLTVVAVGGSIASLVGILGLLNSFESTIRRGEQELVQDLPDRLTVQLDGFYAVDSPVVRAITGLASIRRADPGLILPANLGPPSGDGATVRAPVDVSLGVLDFANAAWTPTLTRSTSVANRPRIVLATKAAEDLDVDLGDDVVLRHPKLAGPNAFTMTSSIFVVAGVHPSPLRALTYVDVRDVDAFGLAAKTNTIEVYPAAGSTIGDVQRAVFGLDGVASVQPVSAVTELFQQALDQFLGFLVITGGAVLALAMLIAFNSTSISVDERRREHATMFAFGLQIRRVVGLLTSESIAVGVAATIVGTGLGYLLTRWMVHGLVAQTVPEFGFEVDVSPSTVLVAAMVGIFAMAVTPLLTARGLRRMDIPDSLRVME